MPTSKQAPTHYPPQTPAEWDDRTWLIEWLRPAMTEEMLEDFEKDHHGVLTLFAPLIPSFRLASRHQRLRTLSATRGHRLRTLLRCTHLLHGVLLLALAASIFVPDPYDGLAVAPFIAVSIWLSNRHSRAFHETCDIANAFAEDRLL